MDSNGYYGELRFPEIAYNLEPIFRANPGTINFSIPALTGQSGTYNSKVIQRNTNISNKEKPSISNVSFSGSIPIKVPKELCCYMNGGYTYKEMNMNFTGMSSTMTSELSGTSDLLSSHIFNLDIGSAGGPTPHSHPGTVTITGTHETRNENMEITSTSGEGDITEAHGHKVVACDDSTIPKGSAWIIMFIGGDINKPALIARYYG